MKLRFFGLLAFALLTVSATSAEQAASLGYRSRLYDLATHGQNVFAVGHPGLLLRSTDRGEHFSTVTGASREALFSIDINRAGIGAVVGRNGVVLLTRDGGSTWTKTNAFDSVPEGEEKPHLFGVDVLESGAIVAVGDFGVIVHSKDGKTWERRSYSLTAAAAPSESASDAAASDKKGKKKKKGRDAKAAKKGKGKKGKDKGAEPATAQAEPAESESGFLDMSGHENAGAEDEARLTSVSFGDDQHGFIVGEFGLILVSSDGGLTWNRQPSGQEGLLFGVHALSDKRAVAVGSDGVVLETVDGRKWTKIPTPTKKHLFGVWASNDLVLAVGADGVAVSRAAGETEFKLVQTNVHSWLSAVTLLDGTNGVVVGGRGRVLSTKDSGQTFALTVKD